jgi:membrane protease YdiL (CAAX protease family)
LSASGPSPFENVRARYIAVAWLMLPFYLPGFDLLLGRVATDWPWYWLEVAAAYYAYALLAAAVWASVAFAGQLPVRACFGRMPSKTELVLGLELTAFLFVASLASAYALFYPLSFVAPDFVQWWFIDVAPLIYFDGDGFPLLANLLMFAFACAIGPALEEVAFRAIVLPRWTRKWGLQRALLASSALFAVAHSDPIGAFLFSAGMSVLYLKTQSLLVPIVCHAFNNLVAWLAEVGYIIAYGPDYVETLQDFLDGWRWGVGCAVAAAFWAVLYFRRPRNEVPWRLPVS